MNGIPGEVKTALKADEQEEAERLASKRRLNAVHSRRKRERKRIEIKSLREQASGHSTRNMYLFQENTRLEQLIEKATEMVQLYEQNPSHPIFQEKPPPNRRAPRSNSTRVQLRTLNDVFKTLAVLLKMSGDDALLNLDLDQLRGHFHRRIRLQSDSLMMRLQHFATLPLTLEHQAAILLAKQALECPPCALLSSERSPRDNVIDAATKSVGAVTSPLAARSLQPASSLVINADTPRPLFATKQGNPLKAQVQLLGSHSFPRQDTHLLVQHQQESSVNEWGVSSAVTLTTKADILGGDFARLLRAHEASHQSRVSTTNSRADREVICSLLLQQQREQLPTELWSTSAAAALPFKSTTWTT